MPLANIRRGITLLSAALLILLALVVGVGRELIKEAERFHAPLEQWLSEQSGLDVRFSRLKGEWSQASPELHLYDVTVSNPSHADVQPVRVAQLSARLSLGNTLRSLSTRLRLRVHGADIHVERRLGRFELLGKPLGAAEGDSPADLSFFSRHQPRISIYDSRLVLNGFYDRRTDASLSYLKLFWNDRHAFVAGEATLRGPDEMRVVIKSDVLVPAGKDSKVQGTSYLSLSQGQLSRWIPAEVASRLPVALSGARGGTEIWLHWFNNAPMAATLKFDWRDIGIQPTEKPAFKVDRLMGVARWQGQWQDFWQVGVRELVVESEGAKWRPATLQVNAKRDQDNSWLYQATLADAVFSAAITPVLGVLPADSRLGEVLAAMQPAGRLQDASFSLLHGARGWRLVNAHGVVRDYSQKAWQNLPGVQHAGVGFLWEDDTLLLDCNETDVTLDYPAMFRDSLHLSSLQGSLAIQLTPDVIRVRSSPLIIMTPHGSAHTRMSLTLPRDDAPMPPEMALQVTLRDFSAEHASLYLPYGVIPEKLLAWLDAALKGGTLTRGDIVFHGPLRKPEQDNGRSVMLGFQVHDGTLQFLPEWQEPIRHVNADVIVENGLVQAHADGGEYYGLQLAASRIWTERAEDVMHLHVQTSGEGEAGDGLRLLRESPLGKTLKGPLSDMELTGPLNVEFELDAPLVAKAHLAGKALVQLSDGELKWPSQRLEASKLGLALTYDLEKGLSSQQLQADFFGSKTQGRLYQQQSRAGRSLRLDLAGSTQVKVLREWLQMPQLSLANGVIPYELQLLIPPAVSRVPATLSIKSSLLGVETDLPVPFGKQRATQRPLEVVFALGGDIRTHRIRYGDLVSVKWESQNGRWKRGGIRLGAGDAVFAASKPWRLTGVLSRFRWQEWADVLARLKPDGQGNQPARMALLSQFDDSALTVQHLFVGDDHLGKVALTLQTDLHYAMLTASGDRVRGRLSLPHTYLDAPAQRSSETPVSLYLQKLVLPAAAQGEPNAPDPALDMLPPPPTMDPRVLPAAHVRIDQLLLGAEDRGRYNLTLKPLSDGVEIENLRMTLKEMDFTGNGRWLRQGDDATTYFVGRGSTTDVSRVLLAWGYAPSIDSESAALDMDVRWLGAPYQFKLARTTGTLRAQLREGHFLKVSNNAVGRVWGLLNFETWMSRMQLRFNDVSDNSMPFEAINGRFVLHDNRVDVSKLRVNSPALKMRMDGLVDLSEQQLNMQWSVTVPVTRNLVLPAAVVGGLPGAATAYVLDKVLSTQLDKLTTLTYDVTGTFDHPETRLRVPLR